MATADVQIIEFRGIVTDSGRDEVKTYLLILDGDYRRKYRKPNFEYLPKEWRRKYQVESFEVGTADSWKTFYGLCAKRLEAAELLDLTEDQPSSGETQGELERPAESSAGEVAPKQEEPEERALPEDALAVFEDLLDEPPERLLSLKFEIAGYRAIIKSRAEELHPADVDLAEAIAEGALALLTHVAEAEVTGDTRMMVQAAVRYFTVAEDASLDWKEGGFLDDAAVFNFVARWIKRPDLIIPLS